MEGVNSRMAVQWDTRLPSSGIIPHPCQYLQLCLDEAQQQRRTKTGQTGGGEREEAFTGAKDAAGG